MTMPLVVYALSRSELGIDIGMNGHRAFLDGFFNSLPFMIGLIEIAADDIRHLAANSAAARFFNTKPEAIPQQWFSQLGMPRETIRLWLKHCHTARRTGAPIQFDYASAEGGEQRWFSATVSTIAAPSGPPFQLSYLIQEITDRKQREYRLEALTALSTALRAASTRAEMLPIILDQVLALLNVEGALLATTHPIHNEMVIALGRGWWASATGQRLAPNHDLGRQTLANGQAFLIAFQRQHLVGPAVHNRFGNLGLRAGRINGHDTAVHVQQPHQLGNGRDFVGFVGHFDLPQHQPIGARPGADHMQGVAFPPPVMRAPQALAVNGYHFPGRERRHRLHPLHKAALERLRVQQPKHPSKRVVRRNAVRQLQKPLQPLPLGFPKGFHFHPTFGPTHNRTDGNGHYVQQQMVPPPPGARIGQLGQGVRQGLQRSFRHRGSW